MLIVPGEITVGLFGSVKNFYTIATTVTVVSLLVILIRKYPKINRKRNVPESQEEIIRIDIPSVNIREEKRKIRNKYIIHSNGKKPEEPNWYPSGWTYNEETGLWDPPDYLPEESRNKWRWDPEKEIWIDKEKEKRLEQYRKYREGKEPTYEEWKVAKIKEMQENKKEQN